MLFGLAVGLLGAAPALAGGPPLTGPATETILETPSFRVHVVRPAGTLDAGRTETFVVTVEQEAALEAGLRAIAEPGLDIEARPFRAPVQRLDSHRYAVRTSFPVRGAWSLALLVVTGDGIIEQARLPVAVVAPAARQTFPVWIGWALGFSPFVALLIFAEFERRRLARLGLPPIEAASAGP